MTSAKGLAGLAGQVLGQTTPSVSKVDVLAQSEDYAVNVYFKETKTSVWVAEELLDSSITGLGHP